MVYMQFSYFVIDRVMDYMYVLILCGFLKYLKVISIVLIKISYLICFFILIYYLKKKYINVFIWILQNIKFFNIIIICDYNYW